VVGLKPVDRVVEVGEERAVLRCHGLGLADNALRMRRFNVRGLRLKITDDARPGRVTTPLRGELISVVAWFVA
jgi:hypothetical protein